MDIIVKSVAQIADAARLTRKAQGIDQFAAASLSGNSVTFISQFENGKTSVEIGRVLELLDQLGIELVLKLPIDQAELKPAQQKLLHDALYGGA
jgi:transcriptional regulator with XRE-family HTH domain